MVAKEPCGSEAAYQRHRRAKEAPCATCTDAHRKYTNTRNYPSPAPDGRAASPGQVVRVRELSRALLGDQRTVEAALGKPGDANRWSGVRASTVIAALLELEDLSFSHRLPADPVGWLRSRMNGGITVEVSGMRKIEDGESWVEWGADVLGLTTKTEVACPKCGGSGVLNGAPSPTKKAVLQAALSLNGSYHPTPTQSIRGLSNPSLGQLRSLTVRLGGGLDDAAAFCDRLASLITKDLPG